MQSLADAIIEENIDQIKGILQSGIDTNELDEYGFTPLIEAAIANNIDIAMLLIEYGVDVNFQDSIGGTALHWAVENTNSAFCKLLLEHGANPNLYTISGQPALVMALLRQQHELKKVLLEHGADLRFAQDFINAKLLGHMFELIGVTNIIDPNNNFVEVDFEGFFLEFSIGLISESLAQFRNHFAARHIRRYDQLTKIIIDVMRRAAQSIKYQQYQVDIKKHAAEINLVMHAEPLLIPVGYEGHAITFVKLGNILVKCDRREDSRLYDNVVFYQMNRPENFSLEFAKDLIYKKQSDEFINNDLPQILDLQPITELKVAAQISGNCSWANVEACIPTLFFLLFSKENDFQDSIPRYKNMALNFFHQWREWNKDRALHFCIDSFHHAGPIRKACKAEMLAAILFQSCNDETENHRHRIESILSVLTVPTYRYILQNYVKVYCYESQSEQGKRFAQLLKQYNCL